MKWIIVFMAYICNLGFLNQSSTPATGPAVANGSIHVSALDGDNIVKYKLNSDFTYATGGQTSGTFLALVPGTYQVYARSNDQCRKILQIEVKWVKTYNPLYRLQWFDKRGDDQFQYRFDIEDSSFVGAVTVLEEFGPEPVEISWRGESNQNVFTGVVSSEARVTLLATEDQQYIGLWTANDRRYRGRLFRFNSDTMVWDVKWVGYMTPQLYSEPYILQKNYYNVFVFTDQLAVLERIPFTDNGGNIPVQRISIMDVIRYCLNKTDISLQIWETFNFYETSMNHNPEDNKLEQLYIDPTIYKTGEDVLSCLAVLRFEMENLGCRLMQADGHWYVDHLPLKAGSAVTTRNHAFAGGSIDFFDVNYRIMLRRGVATPPKVSFVNRDANMNISPIYGKIKLIFDLGIEEENNLLDTGDFENDDIENGQLTNWQISEEQPVAVNPTIETISRDNDTKSDVLQINFDSFFPIGYYSAEPSATIVSKAIPMDFNNIADETDIELSFDVFIKAINKDAAIFFDYSIQFVSIEHGTFTLMKGYSALSGDIYSFVLGNPPDNTDGLIREYVEQNKWETLKTTVRVTDALGSGNMQIIFRASGNRVYDFTTLAQLRTVPTNAITDAARNMREGRNNMRRVKDMANRILQYYLVPGNEIDDSYDVLKPGDQAGVDLYIWKLDKALTPPDPAHNGVWVTFAQLDNVQVKYLPGMKDPDGTVELETVIDADNKIEQVIELKHADLPEDVNLQNISRGWYSLPDGTPTTGWRSVEESEAIEPKSFISYFMKWRIGQNATPRWRIVSTMDHNGVLPSLANVIYEVRTGRIYLPMEMTLKLRSRLLSCEMIEILKGEAVVDEGDPDPDVEPPVTIADFDATDFSPTDFYAV